MSPGEISGLRDDLKMSQKEFGELFGLARLTVSQYETGHRKPGPTLTILLHVLRSLPKKKALDLIGLLRSSAVEVGRRKSRKRL